MHLTILSLERAPKNKAMLSSSGIYGQIIQYNAETTTQKII